MTRSGFCFVLIAALGATRASAQPAPAAPAAPVDKAKAKTAKQYVDAAIAAQSAGDYDTAISLYQKAYDLVPHPVLIFNIAQATRLAGRTDDAIAAYHKYLAADPTGAQAQTARELLAELDAKKAQADAAQQAEAARAAEAARQAEAARAQAAPPPPAPVVVAPAPVDPGNGGRTLRLAGITVGAVGVIGVGVGVGFALHGKSLQDTVEKHYDPSKVHAGDRANTLALVGTIGGGVLLATGVTLYVLGHRQDQEHVALAPLVTEHLAGLALSGGW